MLLASEQRLGQEDAMELNDSKLNPALESLRQKVGGQEGEGHFQEEDVYSLDGDE